MLFGPPHSGYSQEFPWQGALRTLPQDSGSHRRDCGGPRAGRLESIGRPHQVEELLFLHVVDPEPHRIDGVNRKPEKAASSACDAARNI